MVADIIAPDLKILFVGYNPGIYSDKFQHHFAGPGNLFWALLADSQLTPYRLSPEEDQTLLLFGLGITNIVERMTPGSADLTPDELAQGGKVLAAKIARFAPRVVCFLGKDIYRAVYGIKRTQTVAWGYQSPGRFVAPNPSSRSTLPYGVRLQHFRALANLTRYGPDPHAFRRGWKSDWPHQA
ncbi:DNA glycosylase [Sulfobacillus thermotolerans]|uniref:DNA glycosylase n=1 Tax=Sulfobacillus thermotolerans TaxID=338644 RepID=A0ABN5H3E9_9FIRM|nr:DNA glycosylase [Sulfobacillus thermotolerans]